MIRASLKNPTADPYALPFPVEGQLLELCGKSGGRLGDVQIPHDTEDFDVGSGGFQHPTIGLDNFGRRHTDARFDQYDFVNLASAGLRVVIGKEAIHFEPWHAAATAAGERSAVIDGRPAAWELPKMNVAVNDRLSSERGSSA